MAFFSKSLGFLLMATLLISFTVAQSPAPAPSQAGGRRISPVASPQTSKVPTPTISPSASPSPKAGTVPAPTVSPSASPSAALTPQSSSASPPSPPQAVSPTTADSPAADTTPVANSPAEAPAPAFTSGAVSNKYSGFGSVVVMLTVAGLIM